MKQQIQLRRREAVDGVELPADLPPLLQRLYASRGVRSAQELERSVKGMLPWTQLTGVEKAVEMLHDAFQKGLHIVVVGDFDADGATSTALSVLALRALGYGNVSYLVPNRFEDGYGLSPEVVDQAHARGAQMIMTVDNGISSHAGVDHAHALGIPAVVLFPAVPEAKKSPRADEAWNERGLVPQAIRALKAAHPSLCVITDVALDPYNSDGHDGIVQRLADGSLHILNDATVDVLCRQALCHARAGADIVAPSDMMDGRVAAIRETLDVADLTGVSILAYTAKYASAFYGPFRGALDSAPKEGDKQTYQMDPPSWREAIREAEADVAEGADMLMVKPAGPYLDVLLRIRETFALPLCAYQVSGEYSMLMAAIENGWLNKDAAILESLLGIRRAGADFILSYFTEYLLENKLVR